MQEANQYSLWFNGPEFLSSDPEEWPLTVLAPLPSDYEKIRICHSKIEKQKEKLISYNRFSRWRRLNRVVAWIKRFLQNCRIKISTSKTIKQTDLTKELTSEEESAGELKLLQLIHSENLSEEIASLQNKRILNGHFKKLDAFIDDHGLIRVGGRLKHGDFPYASKHQVILPAKHVAIVLLVKHYHRQQHHVDREHLISILRQRFWIIGRRVMCKQVITSCVIC